MELSDPWVVTIVKSANMSREDRATAWSSVFSVKGALRSGFVHKGQAAKLFDFESNNFKYALLDGVHNIFGAEGVAHGLPSRRPEKLKDVVEHRVVQSWNSMRSTQAPLKKTIEKGLGSLLHANLIEYRDFQYDAVGYPQQINATDCGVYACVFMLYAKLGLEKKSGMLEKKEKGEGKLIVDVKIWRSLFSLLLEFLDSVNDEGNIEVQGRIPSLRRAPRRDVSECFFLLSMSLFLSLSPFFIEASV